MSPEDRRDNLLNNNNGEADFDTPSAKRKGVLRKDEKHDGEERACASRGYFVRRTLGKQDEGGSDGSLPRRSGQTGRAAGGEYREKNSAPLDGEDEDTRQRQEEFGGEEDGHLDASRGYTARKTLREREREEELQHRQALRKPTKTADDEYDDDDDEDDDDGGYEEETRTKAPRLVRIFAWIALLAVFFACGYAGANYFLNRTDRSDARIGGVVSGGDEARNMIRNNEATGLGDASYKLYMPKAGGGFEEREIKIRKGLPEEDIRHVLTVYVDGLKELTEFEPGVQVMNIFRSGDWLYIDMSQDFLRSLKKLGKDKSTLVLTGLVHTMQENFPPVKKVKFYIEGNESKDKDPVNIENAWELKS